MLLPLLLKEEYPNTDLWASNVDLAAVGAALHLIVTEIRQQRNDSLSGESTKEQIPCKPKGDEDNWMCGKKFWICPPLRWVE
jgi:hypothetical protein